MNRNHIVTKEEYEACILVYRERGKEYLTEINHYIECGNEQSIEAFLSIFADKEFRENYIACLQELAYACIVATITKEERKRGASPLFITNGKSVQDFIAIIKQIKFLLWRVEFEGGPDTEQKLFNAIRQWQLSVEAMALFIYFAGMDKAGCFLILACIYMDNGKIEEAKKLLVYGSELYPQYEILRSMYQKIADKTDRGNES